MYNIYILYLISPMAPLSVIIPSPYCQYNSDPINRILVTLIVINQKFYVTDDS